MDTIESMQWVRQTGLYDISEKYVDKLKKVFVSSNCKGEVKKRIKHYCEVGNVELVEMKEANDEIGVICKKPFPISVVSV